MPFDNIIPLICSALFGVTRKRSCFASPIAKENDFFNVSSPLVFTVRVLLLILALLLPLVLSTSSILQTNLVHTNANGSESSTNDAETILCSSAA